MSGRGRGAFKGKHGQGKGSGRSNNSTSNTPRLNGLKDHIYQIGSASKANDYETVTNFIINHIMTTFDEGADVTTALENLQPFDIESHKPGES